MKTTRMVWALSSMALAVLAGCAANPVAEPAEMPAPPQAYQQAPVATAGEASVPAGWGVQWWQRFDDATLNALVEKALRQNTDIEVAGARLARARALVRSTDADRKPQLGLSTASGKAGGAYYQATGDAGTVQRLELDASYEVDLVGRLSLATQAARLDARAAAAALAAVRVLVAANVAQGYFGLRFIDLQIALWEQTEASYTDSLRLMKRRVAEGDAPPSEADRLRTEQAQASTQVLALQRDRQAQLSAVAVLVGELPESVQVPRVDWKPAALASVPPGLPSQMLAARPDVAQARATWEAALAREGVASRAWFPQLTLTSAVGTASAALSNLFTGTAELWSINAMLNLALLDGSRRKAQEAAASAQVREAAAQYRGQLLQSFKDVEDQLQALSVVRDQLAIEADAVGASGRALAAANARFNEGDIGLLDLLDARRTDVAVRLTELQSLQAQYVGTVALIKSLGGGWGDHG